MRLPSTVYLTSFASVISKPGVAKSSCENRGGPRYSSVANQVIAPGSPGRPGARHACTNELVVMILVVEKKAAWAKAMRADSSLSSAHSAFGNEPNRVHWLG